MSPNHSIGFCPICGGGLCGIRVCGFPAGDEQDRLNTSPLHGFIVCDECEAIWLQPDLTTIHQYPHAVDPQCPVCDGPLWGDQSRWADLQEVALLGWSHHVCHELDVGT